MTELATLRIHRPALSNGALAGLLNRALAAMVIEMDGRDVGRLHNGQSLVTYVEPGRHNLRVRQLHVKSDPVELVMAPGEDVQLETRPTTINFRYALLISVVRTEAGASAPTRPVDPPAAQLLGVMKMHQPKEPIGIENRRIDNTSDTGASAPTRPVDPTAAEVLGVTELDRSEEPIGIENRRIDNTSGAARLTRTMRVTREWNRTVNLDLHSSRGISADARVGPAWLALRATIERSLSRTYTISENQREEFADELSIEVEAGAAVTVVLAWKRLWQHGVVHALFQGHQIEIPFRVAVGITFDQPGL